MKAISIAGQVGTTSKPMEKSAMRKQMRTDPHIVTINTEQCSALGALEMPSRGSRVSPARSFSRDLTHGSITVQAKENGNYEFWLTLKDVQPGRSWEKAEALCNEINELVKRLTNYPKNWKVYLSSNKDLPEVTVGGSLTRMFELTSRKIGSGASVGQTGNNLCALNTENDLFRLAVGFFRLEMGFPPRTADVGTDRDPGDLCRGTKVFTKSGMPCQTVSSYLFGVSAYLVHKATY